MVIGEQLNKITAERKALARQMTIANNVEITNVTSKEFVVGGDKKPGLSFDFQFITKYGETGSKIEVEGSIFYTDDKKNLEKIEQDWKKIKKIEDEKTVLPVLNRALELGYLQAIALADQLRLPAPIQMPRFVSKEKAAKTKAG